MHDLLKSPNNFYWIKENKEIIMHAKILLHSLFKDASIKLHKKSREGLFVITESLLHGRKLTLSDLGRSIRNKTDVKHSIKRVDRFLGNNKLHKELPSVYKTLAERLLSGIEHPIILVDWSQLGEDDKYYFISAAVPYKGRSLTIYEETHPKSACNKTPTNTAFLDHLKEIMPIWCKPIIVTDAGTTFRCPWFRKISDLNWDFIGRVRGGEKLNIKTQGKWFTCKEIYTKASNKAIDLGTGLLTKRSEFYCKLFLAKTPRKGRSSKASKVYKDFESNDRKHARRSNDPWLLATSLNLLPNHIISIYKKRMCIEEMFRDTKNQRLGFGLKKTKTKIQTRLNILLLIATVATYIAFIIGKTAQYLSLQYKFQSNTIKSRNVLSIFNLGGQIFLYNKLKIPIANFRQTLTTMPDFIVHAGNIL
jgi:hypothetical protein